MNLGYSRFLTISLVILCCLLAASLFFQYYLIGDASIRLFFEDMLRSGGHAEQWFYADRRHKPQGIALVIHGLNLNPDKMHTIISVLNKQGIDVLNLSLQGHGDNYRRRPGTDVAEDRLESFKKVSFPIWLQEAHAAYLKVLLRARRYGVPVCFVGYSLGGLLGCTLLISHPHVHFHRMILFAPALAIQQKGYLLKPLAPFTGFVIDSLSPESYRANSGTPVAAYNALFDALRYFERYADATLNVPTLVCIDEQDEFIDYEALRDLIHEKNFDHWRLLPLRKDEDISESFPHHIIIDKESTGAEAWRIVETEVSRHLR